jgi:hypothetical protein
VDGARPGPEAPAGVRDHVPALYHPDHLQVVLRGPDLHHRLRRTQDLLRG